MHLDTELKPIVVHSFFNLADIVPELLGASSIASPPTVRQIKRLLFPRLMSSPVTRVMSEPDQHPPALVKGLDGFMAFSLCFTTVAIIPSISTAFTMALEGSGPFYIVWTWIFASIFTVTVGLSMAEICSVHLGSVYIWTGHLAPPAWAPVMSYVCGWFNFVGNTFSAAALAGGLASLCSSIVLVLSHGQFEASAALTVALSLVFLSLWMLLSMRRINFIGSLTNIAAVYQLVASFVMLIVLLLTASSFAPADFLIRARSSMDSNIINPDGARPFMMILMALLFSLFSFSGYDSGAQTAAETQDAELAAPRSIVAACCVSALTGLFYICGLLFTTPDASAVLPMSAGGKGLSDQVIVNIYVQTAGTAGGIFLTVLLALCVFFAGQSSLLVASRIAFALSHDGLLPSDFTHIDPDTSAPVRALWLVVAIASIMLCLPLLSPSAFDALIQLTTVCFQISYAIPIWLRCLSSTFRPGRYALSFPSLVHTAAAVWLTLSTLLLFVPNRYPITVHTFNWTPVLIALLCVTLAIAWRWPNGGVSAHFVGPRAHALAPQSQNPSPFISPLSPITTSDKRKAPIDMATLNLSHLSLDHRFEAVATHDEEDKEHEVHREGEHVPLTQ